MKKGKKYLALLAVVFLLVVFCLPMVFALGGGGASSQALFRAALFAAFFVPVMAYVIWMMYRVLARKRPAREEQRTIENIVFDVGQVLMKYDWETYLKSFGFPEEKYEKIADATFLSTVWPERDKGLCTEEEYVRKFVELAPEYEEDIREVIRRSDETVELFPYAETWVKYLKSQGYHLYVLSNYCSYILEKTKKDMAFLPYMDGVVFSCEIHELKPEPEIYRKLLKMFQLKPEKTVFLDDREENCEGARAFGIHAIQFQNFKQGAKELEKLGVR